MPALHALALGPGYAAAVFHDRRKPSTQGPAVRRHAANLLVLLHHPGWPHGPKALAAGRLPVWSAEGELALLGDLPHSVA